MLSWYTEYVSTFRGLVAGFQDNFPQHYWLRFILKMCCFASNVIHQRPGTHFCKTVEVNHAWNHQVTNENFWRKSLRKLCVICTQYKSLYPNNSRTVIFFSKVQIFRLLSKLFSLGFPDSVLLNSSICRKRNKTWRVACTAYKALLSNLCPETMHNLGSKYCFLRYKWIS